MTCKFARAPHTCLRPNTPRAASKDAHNGNLQMLLGCVCVNKGINPKLTPVFRQPRDFTLCEAASTAPRLQSTGCTSQCRWCLSQGPAFLHDLLMVKHICSLACFLIVFCDVFICHFVSRWSQFVYVAWMARAIFRLDPGKGLIKVLTSSSTFSNRGQSARRTLSKTHPKVSDLVNFAPHSLVI